MSVVLSATIMLVDLFVAIMQETVSVAIMQLEVSAGNMWVKTFIEIMQVGICCHYAGQKAEGITSNLNFTT